MRGVYHCMSNKILTSAKVLPFARPVPRTSQPEPSMVTREETAGGGLSFTLAIGTEAIARATVDAATREYVNQLPRIIGRAVAQRYARRLPEYREAADRFDALRATLNAAPSVDTEDAALLLHVAEEESASRRAYEAAAAAVMAALDSAKSTRRRAREERRGVMGDERVSLLPDPLERRLLTAFRSRTGCRS